MLNGVTRCKPVPGGDAVDLEHLRRIDRTVGDQVDAGVVHLKRRGRVLRDLRQHRRQRRRFAARALCDVCEPSGRASGLMRRIAATARPPITSTRQSKPGCTIGGT